MASDIKACNHTQTGQMWLPLLVSSPTAGVAVRRQHRRRHQALPPSYLKCDIDPSGVVKQPDLLRVFRVHALVVEAAGRCGCAELAINAPFR